MAVFNSEEEMKDIAVEVLPDFIRPGSQTEILTEFQYSTGRADIVLLDISQAYWERRFHQLDLTEPIREKHHLQCFLQLHCREPITRDYFYNIGALSEGKKRRSLEWLDDHGYIESKERKISTAKRFRRHITTSIAVELKLSRWKDALEQAKRGSSFTQYQYVAIDEDHLSRALDNIEFFKDSNTGLISISDDGYCEFHFHPERSEPIATLHQWRLNERSIDLLA